MLSSEPVTAPAGCGLLEVSRSLPPQRIAPSMLAPVGRSPVRAQLAHKSRQLIEFPGVDFPSLKAKRLLAVLRREPLRYVVARQRGSHRHLQSERGYPDLMFSFHDGATVPPGAVRKILTRDVGLTEQDALALL